MKTRNETKAAELLDDLYYEERRGVGEHTVDEKHHPYIEISFLARGEGVLQAGNRVYEVNEGDVIFISQGVTHSLMCTSAPSQIHLLACRPYMVPESVRIEPFFSFKHINAVFDKCFYRILGKIL